jgi:hypothetical protein
MVRDTLRAHRGIAIVLVLFVALGMLYSTVTPLFEAPDEQWHFAFVQHVATGRGLPVQIDPLTHLARQEGSQPPLYYLVAAGASFWIDTSDYPSIVWENPHYGYNVPGVVNDNKNLFIHTALEDFPYRGAALAIHVARWVSVLMGALGVWLTYLLALEIFPGRKIVAASAAGVAAFIPQFLFVSSAVSNDSTIVALSALVLWLMTRRLTADRRRPTSISDQWSAVALGVACGLAALAKVSGLGLLALGALVLAWQAFQSVTSRDQKLQVKRDKVGADLGVCSFEILFHFFLFAFSFLLVAGWWYARNFILYGELTGTARMSEIFHVRAAPMPLGQLLVQLCEVWETFWIGFGWGNIRAHPLIYSGLGVFVVASIVGWIQAIRWHVNNSMLCIESRTCHRPQFKTRTLQFIVLVAWIALMFAALVYWMQMTQAPHGRLFFPALPALAILMTWGLAQCPSPLAPRPSPASAQGRDFRFHLLNFEFRVSNLSFVYLSFVIFIFTLSALAPFMILQPAYAYPQTLDENALPRVPNRVDISYEDRIRLLGFDVSPRRVIRGGSTELTLYWQALTAMEQDYSIGLRVLDSEYKVIGTRNSYPGHGMLPTRLWYPGQIIRDVYWLPINADAPKATLAQIQVIVFEGLSKRDLVARDPRGQVITPFIGTIEVAAE